VSGAAFEEVVGAAAINCSGSSTRVLRMAATSIRADDFWNPSFDAATSYAPGSRLVNVKIPLLSVSVVTSVPRLRLWAMICAAPIGLPLAESRAIPPTRPTAGWLNAAADIPNTINIDAKARCVALATVRFFMVSRFPFRDP
jgi:hypothetical protein